MKCTNCRYYSRKDDKPFCNKEHALINEGVAEKDYECECLKKESKNDRP